MKKVFKIIYCFIVMLVFVGCQNVAQNHKEGNSVEMNDVHKAEVPEVDVDTQNQVNKKIESKKPLKENNSEVKMKTKIDKKHILQVEMQNDGKEKISFGTQYQLYRWDGDNWNEVGCLPDVGFKDIVYYLENGETNSDKVDLENVFGKLEAGQYKIEKEVNLQESRIMVSSEFDISDAKNEEKVKKKPDKKLIKEKRQKIFEGVAESDRKMVIEKVKKYNLKMEHAYLWDNIFETMSNPDDLQWNVLYKKGEVQIGWAFEEGEEYDPEKTTLSEAEYNKKYGKKVICDNEETADDFIMEFKKIKKVFGDETILRDFDNIISYMRKAKNTRDVKYLENIYEILHDMDYYLFRDTEEITPYLKDTTLIEIYYGVLNIYK